MVKRDIVLISLFFWLIFTWFVLFFFHFTNFQFFFFLIFIIVTIHIEILNPTFIRYRPLVFLKNFEAGLFLVLIMLTILEIQQLFGV